VRIPMIELLLLSGYLLVIAVLLVSAVAAWRH
jgi:hypothetical protein